MGLTGTTLVLGVSGLLRERCSPQLQERNETRLGAKQRRLRFLLAGTVTLVDGDQFFFRDGETCFYNDGGRGSCQDGSWSFVQLIQVCPRRMMDYTPSPTEKPKQKKKEYRRRLRNLSASPKKTKHGKF
uniref:Putative secreted salivary gland protein 2 n=1 Tax=Ixodes ricinus TaxID=34613 RepID=V5H4K0_IXORI